MIENAGATPTTSLVPTGSAERIVAMDVLRGFALLGILLMNIKTFSMISATYFFPTVYGDLTGANLAVWWLNDILANRKFMTLFSLLFGAGVVLQSQRAKQAGRSFRGFFYRRMFWLWVIGLVHAYLFWEGDILVTYAVCGLFLYPLRNVRPGRLLTAGLIVLFIGSAISLGSGFSPDYWTDENLQEFTEQWNPSADRIDHEITALTGSWFEEIRHRYPYVLEMHLFVIPYLLIWRGLGVMLLGMALFKWGLLQAGRPRTSRIWIALGVLIGIPVSIWGALRQFASGWDPISSFFIDSEFGYWGSLLVALGWAGLVFLAIDQGWAKGLQHRLAAIGRTALSNYLLQTLVCTTLFYGRGFGLFGSVPRIGQMGIVLAVWILQLWLAPWWLKRFRFGPVEWIWRALAYGKRPQMRR